MISKILIFFVKLYQWILSPVLGGHCRFTPSCSYYMIDAINEWGPIKGTWMGLKRIGKCHPWGPHGPDPVPQNPNRKTTQH